MKNYRFLVYFTGTEPVEIYTGSFQSAVILATAERLQAGLNTFAIKVDNTQTGERRFLDKEKTITINWEGPIIRVP